MASPSGKERTRKPIRNDPISRRRLAEAVVYVVRMIVGIVFLWAGLIKLQYPLVFLDAVYQYKLLGPTSGLALTLALPTLEVLIGVSLITNIWAGGGLLVSTLLTLMFVVIQICVIWRGDSVGCGCFGDGVGSHATIGWWTLGRAVLLSLLAMIGYRAWIIKETRVRMGTTS